MLSKLLSQVVIISTAPDPKSSSILKIEGPLKNINSLADVVNLIVRLIYPLAAVLLFFYFAWAGINLIMSRGEPEKVSSAKSRLTSALIGFLLLFLSYFLVGLIARMSGLGSGLF